MAIAALPLHLYLPETADVGSRSVFLASVPILFSERPPAFDRVSPRVRLRLVPRSIASRPAFAKK